METHVLTGGLYAVFNYKGDANDFQPTFEYIFRTWLPNSDYVLDDRPHFEIMGEKYKLNDPNSEEELWVPIRMKE
jgi:AraC family transcriptional regulator